MVVLSVIALIAVVGLTVSINYGFPTNPTSTQASALPPSLCSPATLPPTNTSTIDVFQVRPGSAAVICVNYSFSHSGSYSFTPDYGPQASGAYRACDYLNGTASKCSDLSITASQSTFDHSADQNVTIAYTIVAGRNITGIWWFFVGSCEAIPLVFGAAPSPVSYPVVSCVTSNAAPSSAAITGYWNLNVSLARG